MDVGIQGDKISAKEKREQEDERRISTLENNYKILGEICGACVETDEDSEWLPNMGVRIRLQSNARGGPC
jgi:hypothetical protein